MTNIKSSDKNNDSWQGHGAEGIESRRRILRSIGAGGAIAGAPVPGLATALVSGRPYTRKDGRNYHATASAVGSMIGSAIGSAPPMWGYPTSYYTNSSSWGSNWTNGRGRQLNYALCADPSYNGERMRFFVCFELTQPSSGSTAYRECQDIIRNFPSSDEAIFLTALFNANKQRSNFPYSPSQILDLYKGLNPFTGGSADPALSMKARDLFRDYLSLGPV